MTETSLECKVMLIVGVLVIALALLDLAPDRGTALMNQGTIGFFVANISLILLGSFIVLINAFKVWPKEKKEGERESFTQEIGGNPKSDENPGIITPSSQTTLGPDLQDDQFKDLIKVMEFIDKYMGMAEEDKMREEYLILRLLTGTEKVIYQTIFNNGGEMLQKDIIARTKMSNAKVSRTIDRLESRGIVTKMRFGATNRVRITIEPPNKGNGDDPFFAK